VSMESMALGTPVVGTNSKGIMEYANKENSIILNNRNPELIANTIIQLWDNKEKYNNLVNQGIKTAKSHNWATIMPSIEKKYLTIIENENRK
ncbi:MAG: glycosyltransferase, partial [bacterium]